MLRRDLAARRSTEENNKRLQCERRQLCVQSFEVGRVSVFLPKWACSDKERTIHNELALVSELVARHAKINRIQVVFANL